MPETFPPEVTTVRQQLEDWRAPQTHKGPLPTALWQAAAALLPRFPITLVARACRLTPSKLKQVATGQAPKRKPAPAAFRTLTTEILQQAAALMTTPAAEVCFTLERCDHSKLTITCPAQAPELAAALCCELLRTNATNKPRSTTATGFGNITTCTSLGRLAAGEVGWLVPLATKLADKG